MEKQDEVRCSKLELHEQEQYTIRRNIETLVLIGSKLSDGLSAFGLTKENIPEDHDNLMKETYLKLTEMVKKIKAV